MYIILLISQKGLLDLPIFLISLFNFGNLNTQFLYFDLPIYMRSVYSNEFTHTEVYIQLLSYENTNIFDYSEVIVFVIFHIWICVSCPLSLIVIVQWLCHFTRWATYLLGCIQGYIKRIFLKICIPPSMKIRYKRPASGLSFNT